MDKYEEALARARKKLQEVVLPETVSANLLYDIFPELAESEDERIMKEIISALKFANDDGVYDKHIAYLEKQKEKKSNIEICPHSIKSKSYLETGYPIEQKPAEWSDEDEIVYKQLVDWLHEIGKTELPKWFESLRGRLKKE